MSSAIFSAHLLASPLGITKCCTGTWFEAASTPAISIYFKVLNVIGPRPKSRNCQGHIIPWNGCSPFAWLRWVRLSVSNHYLDWPQEWGAGPFKQAGLHFPPHLKRFCRSLIMGGEPVTTKPSVLKIYEDDGRVMVSGMEFVVSEVLIAEVSGLPNEGEVVSRDKMNQGGSQVMKYLTLEGKFRKVFGYHIAILNSMRNKEKINIPLFLFKSMEKFVHAVKAGKGKAPLHQGPMKMIADFEINRKSFIAGPSKGGFLRVRSAPISKAQLFLGPAPSSPLLVSGDTATDSEGDSRSPERNCPATNPKEKGSRKRKPPAQVLSANIAKCNRRSSRLQRKTAEKIKLMDDAESSEEDQKSNNLESLGGRSSPSKVTVATPLEKSAKSSEGSHSLSEELHCHLRVLNGLGGSLTSTCACINLLTLEITNYLKEVLKNMKDMNAAKK
eukprot:Gb_41589 [translate_table: standard]